MSETQPRAYTFNSFSTQSLYNQFIANQEMMSSSMKELMARSAGEERFKADKRQFAGLMFALSICVTYFPLANIATAIGPDGTTPTSGLPLAGLISGCILTFVGSAGMFTGYLGIVHDYSNKYLTAILLVIIQLTWMPFLTDLINVGQMTASRDGFIPTEYNATETDEIFVGSMGILGIVT